MAGVRTNSGSKIKFAEGTIEAVNNTKSALAASCEEMYQQCNSIRMAVVDRAYANLVVIARKTIECANAVARATAEDLIEPLTKDELSGEALTAASKKVLGELEDCYNNTPEILEIAESVTAGRGLDENWTDASQAAFSDACAKFITVRQSFIYTLGDLVSKNKEEDSEGAYMNIGRAAENISNSTVTEYKKLEKQLEEAGLMVASVFRQAEAAGARVSAVGEAEAAKDILHAKYNV